MSSLIVDKKAQPELYRNIISENEHVTKRFVLRSIMIAGQSSTSQAQLGLTTSFIRSAHHFSTANILNRPGDYRTKDNRGAPAFLCKPAPARQLNGLMNELVMECNRDWHKLETVELAGYAMWRIMSFQAFHDANKRTARATTTFILGRRFGINPLIYGPHDIFQRIRQDSHPYFTGILRTDETVARAKQYGTHTGRDDTYHMTMMLSHYLRQAMELSRA